MGNKNSSAPSSVEASSPPSGESARDPGDQEYSSFGMDLSSSKDGASTMKRNSVRRSGSFSFKPSLQKQKSVPVEGGSDKSTPWLHTEYEAEVAAARAVHDAHLLYLWEHCQGVGVPFSLGAAVNVSHVACGQQHCAAVTTDGHLFTWGSNVHGQLGRATAESDQAFPTPERAMFALHMQGLEPRVALVACGARHTLLITDRSLVLAFGDNGQGQCCYPSSSPPRKVSVVSRAGSAQPLYGALVAGGDAHSLVLSVDGELFAGGDNSHGQLGLGAEPAPEGGAALVIGVLGVPLAAIACGALHSGALTACGVVYLWGSNTHGQLGVPEPKLIRAPFALQALNGAAVTRVQCAGNHTFAVTQSGEAYAFGDASRNQICVRSDTREVGADFVCKKPLLVAFGDDPAAARVCEVTLSASGGLALVIDVATRVRSVWCWGQGVSSAANGQAVRLDLPPSMCVQHVALGGGSGLIALCRESDDGAPPLPSMRQLPFAHFDHASCARMIEMARSDKNTLSHLAAFLHFVLSHPTCMNGSFLDPVNGLRHSGLVSGLDMTHVRGFFIEVQRLNSALLFNAMLDGACAGIQYLYDHRLAHSTEILRMFLLLLDAPIILNPDKRNRKLLDQLLFCMLGLPQQLKTCLLTYLGEHAPIYFAMPVQAFQRYLTFLILHGGHQQSISNCVTFLSFLNQINEVKRHIPVDAFYNDTVSSFPQSVLEKEYWKWRNRQMSFCQYPFLLSAHCKSEVLQIDAMVSMKEQMETAIMTSVIRGDGAVTPFLVLVVRRDNLMADALAQVQSKPAEILKRPLKIKFVGEEGIDAGGVKKEFFQLVMREILDPNYGMFVYREKKGTFWFNLAAEDMGAEFGLVGTLLGLAIYNGVILDVAFPFIVYKLLCNRAVGLEDLRDFDEQSYKNMRALLAYEADDVEDVFCLDFSVSYDYYGSTRVVDLVPDGRDVEVTQQNKQQYVKLYVEWLFVGSVRRQFDAFSRGFKAVGGPTLTIFRPEELELLVVGSENVNIDELQQSTTYKGGYAANHKVVRWFWDVVRAWPVEKQKKLLTFATGSDRVPIKGLAAMGFVLQCNTQDTSRLPTASTCFNTLLLPCYASKEQLREKLEISIENNQSFGLK